MGLRMRGCGEWREEFVKKKYNKALIWSCFVCKVIKW